MNLVTNQHIYSTRLSVAICISTRKRTDGLKILLDSIFQSVLENSQFFTKKIVIVENDDKSYSKYIIENYVNKFGIEVVYEVERQIGISYARNTCVRLSENVDIICFTDDDQIVKYDWLEELVRCYNHLNVDGVYGCNPPIFNRVVPNYISKYFTPAIKPYGTVLMRAPTNCLLLRKSMLNKLNGPFDIRFNLMGGGDTFLTLQLYRLGHKIVSNPDAISFEIIPENRISMRYIIQRSFKNGISVTNQIKYLPESKITLVSHLVKLIIKLAFGLTSMIPAYILLGKHRLIGIRYLFTSLGGIYGFVSNKFEIYSIEKNF